MSDQICSSQKRPTYVRRDLYVSTNDTCICQGNLRVSKKTEISQERIQLKFQFTMYMSDIQVRIYTSANIHKCEYTQVKRDLSQDRQRDTPPEAKRLQLETARYPS